MSGDNRTAFLETINGRKADRIPLMTEWHYLPRGEEERKARNNGLGVIYSLPCMHTVLPHVRTTQSSGSIEGGKPKIEIVWETPVGTITTPHHERPFTGAMEGTHDYEGIGSYLRGEFIHKPEDWDILEFIAKDFEFSPYYKHIENLSKIIGNDGGTYAFLGFHSAYTTLLIEWVGANQLYIDEVRYPEQVKKVLNAISEKYAEQYSIAAKAPADFVKYGDHIDEAFITPNALKEYIIPDQNRFVRIAHEEGKITAIHCDGRLNGLKQLIGELDNEIIHGITPPPVGNLPIKEALELWEDKILWVNYEYYSEGVDALKKHLIELLRSIVPGYRIIMDPSTERWVPPECLRVFMDIMSQCTLPLTEEKIDKIEKSVK